MVLQGKKILIGVSGSIAAYKAADLCSQLGKLGAEVHVILTESAGHFIGSATFQALTHNPVLTNLWEEPHSDRITHIELAQSMDLILLAPATANILAKMAHGLADDLLSTCLLAVPSTTPVLIAPAMNTKMWEHPATQANLQILTGRGIQIVSPAEGLLACKDVGVGKLADVGVIVENVQNILLRRQTLSGKQVLITAGPTREPIDPVRFLTNRSSGKMGYALARAAADLGAQVTLISGPVSLPAPTGVKLKRIETADELLAACTESFEESDLFISAAAVSDYTPMEQQPQKIKKTAESQDKPLILALKRTPDVLASMALRKRPSQVVVGFAAETESLLPNAKDKLKRKNLDLIIANDVTQKDTGFEVDTNQVILLWADGRQEALPLLSKLETAEQILRRLEPLLQSGRVLK